MPIASEADLYAALPGAWNTQWVAGSVVAGSGQLACAFRQMLIPAPATGTPTASGAALDRTALGALAIPGSAAGKANYITGVNVAQSTATTTTFTLFYDRLVETGALDATLTTAQTVNSVALPSRATGGANVEMWIEIYSTIGASFATVATISYTNQAGTSGQIATCAIPAQARFATSWPVTLAIGDTGVRSVQSVTLSASTGGAGNFGITLRKQIGPMVHIGGIGGGQGVPYSSRMGWADVGLAKIPDDACIEVCIVCGAINSGIAFGNLQVVQG